MSTDIIDTQYGHACCVAVHHHPNMLAGYRAHLVHQVGDDAPTLEEIKSLGAEVSMAWGMGVMPRCFLCGSNVQKGGCCKCVVEGLPFRAPRAVAESLAARGEKHTSACRFACSRCGTSGTMSGEQLLRGDSSRQPGDPYALCTKCVREVARAVKEARRVDHAAQAAAAIDAARASAQAAVESAMAVAEATDRILKAAAERLTARVRVVEEMAAIVTSNGGDSDMVARYTSAGRADVDSARKALSEAQKAHAFAAERAAAALAAAQAQVRA